jgi:hypothetical protein
MSDGISWLDGRDLFESFNCMKFQAEAEFCAANSKDFDNVANWTHGLRFAAYGGVVCKAVGMDLATQKSEVEKVFQSGESTAVERALMKYRFQAEAASGDDLWDAPVDITPAGGAVKPAVGVALLEGFAGDNYVGAPTIHIPRTIGSLALNANTAVWDGNTIHTILGSRVAVGVGYDFPNTGPTGTAAAAGEKWMYATGQVVVLKGDLVVQQAFEQSDNQVFVLGERGYVVAVDCFVAAVKVQVSA